MCTTGKILVEMCVPEIDQQCLNRNITYIYILYIYYIHIIYYIKSEFHLKPYLKNLIYSKTCYFYICIWDCNVSWIYKHKNQQVNISYSPSATFIPLLFYQLLPFQKKNVPSPFFEEETKLQLPSLLFLILFSLFCHCFVFLLYTKSI